MSHGGGAGGRGQVSSDPNLTPLLDMVLQLVMFFMLVANFIMDELSDKIHLPVASQAKPLTAKDANVYYLNVSKDGKVLLSVGEPLTTPEQIKFHMDQVARNHVLGQAQAREKVTVIIRADKETRFLNIHKTIVAIKQAGFKKLQLRAEIASNS
jgi:biopolymer transport protein ExbD